MNVIDSETPAKQLEAIREKIAKCTDPKEKTDLGREARKIRSEQAKRH